MTSKPALQPLVCCLGNPVAGNPTQFVMSRAARDCGLDWRFFTSQVTEESFEDAVRGVQALGMQGLVVLDPFQSAIIPWLDTVTQCALKMNRVTVARSDGNSWLGDNLFPTALWQSLLCAPSEHEDAPPAAQVLETNSEFQKGEACLETPLRTIFVGSDALFDSMDLSRPHSQCLLERWVPGTSLITEERLSGNATLEWSTVFFEKSPDLATAKAILGLPWCRAPQFVCLEGVSQQEGRKAQDLFLNRGFRAMEPVEWMVREAMANFGFWTGVTPSADGVRESFEEYLQW